MRSGWEVLFQPLAISGSSEQVSFLGTSLAVEMVAMVKEGRVMAAYKTRNLHVRYLNVNNVNIFYVFFFCFFFDAIKMRHDQSSPGASLRNGLLSRERLQLQTHLFYVDYIQAFWEKNVKTGVWCALVAAQREAALTTARTHESTTQWGKSADPVQCTLSLCFCVSYHFLSTWDKPKGKRRQSKRVKQ